MDFSQIALSRQEKAILKKSSQIDVLEKDCQILLTLKLVDKVYKQERPGGMPRSTGWCHINDNGILYLRYRKDVNRTRYTIPIIVSAITAIITTELEDLIPRLWSLILQWI